MRIRKNAKNSKLFNTNSNSLHNVDECLLRRNLCQLNQSPWDIITSFPSSDSSSSSAFHQLDYNECYYNVSLAGNGISIDSSADFDSVPSPLACFPHSVRASPEGSLGSSKGNSPAASVKINFEVENYDLVYPKNECEESLRFEGIVTNDIREEITLCDKRDKKGWQCGKVVKNGEIVCDHHHILELQNHTLSTTKKTPKPKPKPKPKPVHGSGSQATKRASTNPYEFYYYSGFGPSWGKKRETASNGSNTYIEPTKVVSSNGNNKFMDETNLTKDEMDIQNDEGPTKMELDYMDDDNKKPKTGNISGKKRGRKRIKALRSDEEEE